MLNGNIKKCTLDQVTQLQALAIKTYRETFAESNSEALLQQYFKASLNIEKLCKQLQEANSEFYFIYSTTNSTKSEVLAGFLKLNIAHAQTDILDPDALEVEKIYLLKDFLSQGLGKTLINFAIERAKQQHKKYLWLGVWEHNFPAIAFYERMGFKQFSTHGFDMGGDIQTDLLLKKIL
ncbi:GNAT family N-acetyltransferase [Psychromonas sp. RZ22]|uniref:GNAT family N-acetyltransferase n=1 Tax=Psychromonas algarum TaxID=2555643 RepID=UPI001068B838|nr:GNAT family N-acetyltransferase [Psychromonas sp. RZ22]TEW55531.1 GNAT family N-acetyltransferase [Psychromonas sp. RZ22]